MYAELVPKCIVTGRIPTSMSSVSNGMTAKLLVSVVVMVKPWY